MRAPRWRLPVARGCRLHGGLQGQRELHATVCSAADHWFESLTRAYEEWGGGAGHASTGMHVPWGPAAAHRRHPGLGRGLAQRS